MNRKLVTSVKISQDLNKKMLHTLIEKGYGLRGKSRWIIEAIEDFVKLDNYAEYVDIASEIRDLNEVISIRLPEDLIRLMDTSVIEVRLKFPAMEGVKSNIIRASIIQKLLRE